jgi:hypothetical protein
MCVHEIQIQALIGHPIARNATVVDNAQTVKGRVNVPETKNISAQPKSSLMNYQMAINGYECTKKLHKMEPLDSQGVKDEWLCRPAAKYR